MPLSAVRIQAAKNHSLCACHPVRGAPLDFCTLGRVLERNGLRKVAPCPQAFSGGLFHVLPCR